MIHHILQLVVALSSILAVTSSAFANNTVVDVIPLTENCDWAVAPDGSGLVVSSTDGTTAEYVVGISSEFGFTTTFISVSDSDSWVDQEGDSGAALAAPFVIQNGEAIAFALAVTNDTTDESTRSSWSSRSWLDSYAEWFNSTFGSGWSEAAGGVIHDGLTLVMEEETLANTSDGAILTGTVIVSVPAAVGIVYGGEVVLGVVTFGGSGATLTGGTVLSANRLIHIFGQARHRLTPLLNFFGGNQTAAFNAVQSATVSALTRAGITSGTFEVVVAVGGMNVTVRGIVENGIVKIGTFFM